MHSTLFFRLLDAEDKGTALQQTITALSQNPTPEAFAVNSDLFQEVPRAPFAYWLSSRVLTSFRRLPSVGESFMVRSGSVTFDDFRFLRATWEIPGWIRKSGDQLNWHNIAKGGEYSEYYFDIHLLLNWKKSGDYVAIAVYEHRPREGYGWGKLGRNIDYFGKSSITWSRRSQKGFSARILPEGCVFSDKSPVVQRGQDKELLTFLGIANTPLFRALLKSQMAFGSYEVGAIERTPLPSIAVDIAGDWPTLVCRAWSLKRNLDTITQTSHAFILPALLQVQGATLSQRAQAWADTVATTEQQLTQIQAEIDALAFELYGISPEEVGAEETGASGQEPEAEDAEDDDEDAVESADLPSLVHGLIEYALGVALGRFDIRLAIGEKPHPPEPEPFDPLLACSPGMLVVESTQEPELIHQPDNLPPLGPTPRPPPGAAGRTTPVPRPRPR
ncbi:MAG: hypothetical protein AAGH67_16065, partial [Cyanobacteria bacterium P01_H01_bin.162]